MYDSCHSGHSFLVAVCCLVLLNHTTDRSIVSTTMMRGWRVELDSVWLVRCLLLVLIVVDLIHLRSRCSVHSQSMLANSTFFLQHTPSIVSPFLLQPHSVLISSTQSLRRSRLPYTTPHRSRTLPTPPGHRQQRIPMAPFTYPTHPFPGIRYVQQKVGRVFNT